MTSGMQLSEGSIQSLISQGLASLQHGVTIVAIEATGTDEQGAACCPSATSQALRAQFGRIVYCNEAFGVMCGRSTQELLGSSFDQLIGPDTDPEQVGRFREAIYNQQADTVQLRCYHSNGSTFWNSMSIGPIQNMLSPLALPTTAGAGVAPPPCASTSTCISPPAPSSSSLSAPPPILFMALHHDVSPLVSEQDGFRLRDLALQSCSEGITLVDPNLPEMPIIYVNSAFLEMTGYTREEVLGRNCRFLQGPATDQEAIGRLRQALRQHHKCTVQLLNYRKDGRCFWNLLSVTPVLDSSGRLTSYIGVQSDITELVTRKEEEQRALEAKVAAEAEMEAKSMFLANMSHEIRTPLNGMMAMAQLLLSSVLTPEQRDLAETILESSTSLLGILGDILDFSKLDQGAVQLQRRPFCLRGTIEACIEMVAGDALKKGLQVAYLIQDEELASGRPLLGDSVRVRQILANLLSNAIKFTEHGDVVVTLRVEPPGFTRRLRAAKEQQQQAQGQGCSAPVGGHATAAKGDGASLSPASARSVCRTAHGTMSGSSVAGGSGSGSGSGTTCSSLDNLSSKHSMMGYEPGPGHDSGGESSGEGASHHLVGTLDSSSSGDSNDRAAPMSEQPSDELGAEDGAEDGDGHGAGSPEIHISVSDTGIGIDQAQAAKLFQCFKQGSETMSRRYGGTGLGLAISRQLTELMGGEIWVESEPGCGSTFHFTLATEWASSPGSGRKLEREREREWVRDEVQSRGRREAGREAAYGEPAAPSGSDPSSSSSLLSRNDLPSDGGPGVSWSWSSGPGSGEQAVAEEERGMQESNSSNQLQLLESMSAAMSAAKQQQQHGGGGGGGSAAPSHDPVPGASPFAASEQFLSLHGKRVLVDVAHAPTAMQILQSCRLLGMVAECGDVRSGEAGCRAPGAGHGVQYDLAVVGMEHAVDAIRRARKGRPLVVLGNKSALPGNLHPLAVFVPLPVRHARLAAALLKSVVLLKWLPNGAAPMLSSETISLNIIKDLKNWRLRAVSDAANSDFARRTSLDNSALCRRMAAARSGEQQPGAAEGGYIPMMMPQPTPSASGGCKAAAFPEPIPEHSVVGGVGYPSHASGHAGYPKPGLAPDAPSPSSWAPQLLTYSQQRLKQKQQAAAAGQQREEAEQMQQQRRQAAMGVEAEQHQRQVQVQAEAAAAAAQAQAQAVKPFLKILIAEDNKVNQKVVLKVLQRICSSDCLPDVVENGVQVLAALELKQYDVILMDIHMPEMDGLEASRRIRQRFPRPEDRPRIVALTADTMQTLHDRCREAGIEEFILKPFRVEDLKRVMNVCNHVVTSRREEQALAGLGSGRGGVSTPGAGTLLACGDGVC